MATEACPGSPRKRERSERLSVGWDFAARRPWGDAQQAMGSGDTT
jgi:hypothetical protein